MFTPADVQVAVSANFPEEQHAAVLHILTRTSSFGARVQVAILALASGSLREVERLAEVAHDDSRNVLYWAEFPDASKTGTKRDMAERYRRLGVAVPDALQ